MCKPWLPIPFIFIISCKDPSADKKINTAKDTTYQIGVILDCASYNKGTPGDTFFTLRNSAGNILRPDSDTCKWTSGNLEYEHLAPGAYTYTIRSIFDDWFEDTIMLSGDRWVNLSTEGLYENMDSLDAKGIAACDSIRIAFGNDVDSKEHSFIFYKIKKGYLLCLYESGDTKGRRNTTDSSIVIGAITWLIKQSNQHVVSELSMDPNSALAIRADTSLYQVNGIEEDAFNKLYRQFKARFFK